MKKGGIEFLSDQHCLCFRFAENMGDASWCNMPMAF